MVEVVLYPPRRICVSSNNDNSLLYLVLVTITAIALIIISPFQNVLGSFAGPIVLQVKTDESLKGIAMIGPPINRQQALTFVQEGYENGFRLTYSFTNTCPTITV